MRMVRSFIRRRPGKSFTESKRGVRNQCGAYFISEVGRLDPRDLVRTVLCFRGVDSELVYRSCVDPGRHQLLYVAVMGTKNESSAGRYD